jgi:L,D-peptidoglycan transpeptidase YkuD (ErfK/YbiS/YcfS/YnhG family)
MRVRRAVFSAVYGMALVALAGCGTELSSPGAVSSGKEPQGGIRPSPVGTGSPLTAAPEVLPGVGARTLAKIPADTRQVLLVTGRTAESNRATARLYERGSDEAGWVAGSPSWAAHNALRGWTSDHHVGDLRSPIGVFTLTAAGGRLKNPGTALPYTRSSGFMALGAGFEGEPLAGSFDYVVAIDYNYVPGTSPLDVERPMGEDRGGGIWVHVDHGGPTQGCVSLATSDMRTLLRALEPDDHPVVVMGPAAALAS